MENTYSEIAKVFKAFCDPKRLAVLDLLKSGEKCACMLTEALETTQSGLSYHMKILCESGVVKSRQEGKWTHYSIDTQGAEKAAGLLREITIPEPHLSASAENTETGRNKNMDRKTKLYILTGFLGSGKTTILLKLLENISAEGQKAAVIQNEFGKLGIDGEIIRNDDIHMIELTRGSIFCSCLRLSFVQALADMAQYDPDYLFIESSGLGDPSNTDEILEAASVLCGDKYDFMGAICLVDAVNFLNELDDLETVFRQLKHCHMAVISKTDLVSPQKLEELENKIREINPVCEIRRSAMGDLDLSFLHEDLMKYSWAESEDTTNSEETKPKTLFMNFEGSVPEDKLRAFLLEIAEDLYRAKGFFRIDGKGWNQVDLAGRTVDIKPCDQKELSQLVFISKTGPLVIRKIVPAWEKIVGLPMKLKN